MFQQGRYQWVAPEDLDGHVVDRLEGLVERARFIGSVTAGSSFGDALLGVPLVLVEYEVVEDGQQLSSVLIVSSALTGSWRTTRPWWCSRCLRQ